jgi:hypothetical protein
VEDLITRSSFFISKEPVYRHDERGIGAHLKPFAMPSYVWNLTYAGDDGCPLEDSAKTGQHPGDICLCHYLKRKQVTTRYRL